ncbi:hypothetical protein OTB20_36695 [Streptomyces sp. H27-H1]|uniref:hypothetical protein n=1 Tax=Streptomyces sp. H27-H1 TaxID=2996461 RepID=UPI002271528E|nr:hypothetical protein [Streptomyces sp. H27-H1]MCY0931626.1 hypothetical protein [Streptomyces sp. H27-H1]
MGPQLSAPYAPALPLSARPVCDSRCTACDDRQAWEVATYTVSGASQADQAAASLGGEAHVHYVARGDLLAVVVPARA